MICLGCCGLGLLDLLWFVCPFVLILCWLGGWIVLAASLWVVFVSCLSWLCVALYGFDCIGLLVVLLSC